MIDPAQVKVAFIEIAFFHSILFSISQNAVNELDDNPDCEDLIGWHSGSQPFWPRSTLGQLYLAVPLDAKIGLEANNRNNWRHP